RTASAGASTSATATLPSPPAGRRSPASSPAAARGRVRWPAATATGCSSSANVEKASMETAPSRLLHLPCRYYRVYTDAAVPCVEANFRRVERRLAIPIGRAALVLVDVWNTHYVASWLARPRGITRARIVPALEAARRAGLAVIHAPSPPVA